MGLPHPPSGVAGMHSSSSRLFSGAPRACRVCGCSLKRAVDRQATVSLQAYFLGTPVQTHDTRLLVCLHLQLKVLINT